MIALASPRVASSVEEGLDKIRHFVAEAAARGRRSCASRKPTSRGYGARTSTCRPSTRRSRKPRSGPWRGGRGSTRSPSSTGRSGSRTPAGRSPPTSSTPGARCWGVRPRTKSTRPRSGSTCPARPGNSFEVNGTKFGVAICHEGLAVSGDGAVGRRAGAKIVFHPQHSGSDRTGNCPTQWGAADGPYYEKAMVCRAVENEIYFASANYALRFPESATSIVAPSGGCMAYLPYGSRAFWSRMLTRNWPPAYSPPGTPGAVSRSRRVVRTRPCSHSRPHGGRTVQTVRHRPGIRGAAGPTGRGRRGEVIGSTASRSRPAPRPRRGGNRARPEVEKHFRVHDTPSRRDPLHRTVEITQASHAGSGRPVQPAFRPRMIRWG